MPVPKLLTPKQIIVASGSGTYIVISSIAGATLTCGNQSYTLGPNETAHAFGVEGGTYTCTATKTDYSTVTDIISISSGFEYVTLIPLFLPTTYQRVEYLQSSSTNGDSNSIHINTGISYFADFEIECMRTDNNPTKFAGVHADYCVQRNSSEGRFAFYNSTSNIYVSSASILQRTVCKWKNNEIYINGDYVASLTKSLNPATGITFTLFGARASSGGYYSNVRIYYCKLWDSNGNLVRNMYPCQRIVDNVLGFYDKVNDSFFTGVGSGIFISGPNV